MGFMTLLVIASLIFWILKKYSPPSRLREYGDRLPGPKSYPLVGNGLVFLTSKTLVQTLDELCTYYGPVLRLWLGKKLWICLSDPADIAVFLSSTKHLNKTDIYRLLDSWLGTKGLVTSNVDVWRTHRKLLTPSFHFRIVEASVPMMQRKATVLCRQLQNEVQKAEFDIMQYLERCSFDILCETAMGTESNTQSSQNSAYLHSLTRLRNAAVKRMFQTWLHPELIFSLSTCGKVYYDELRVIKEEVEKVILGRRRMLESRTNAGKAENNENVSEDGLHVQVQSKDESSQVNHVQSGAPSENDTHTAGAQKSVKPFLDFMLSEGSFTNEEIENEVQTFMFAGQDTTMTTMSFCLYLLSQHPKVQERCLEEIRKLIATGGTRTLTYSDYMNLKYVENVIKETLRMFTTVPLISRAVDEDVLLPSGYLLPAGSLANFNLLHMHNNEKYFPNPREFNPSRFKNREMDKSHQYSFLPFSAGPRNCLGQKFAMLEMKIVLTEALLHYEFLPAEKVKSLTIETGIVLRSLENMPVRISRREERI